MAGICSPFLQSVAFVHYLQERNCLLRKSNMTSVDRPWNWTQSGWMSRPIPAIIFTIPSGISRLPWVSSPWLWNFTPPFPRHGRATNTRGGGWRRGSRRARTVASGARRRRVWSLRATTNGHELAGADLPEAALALMGNPDPCLGGRRSWAGRAGSVGLRLDPFCLIEFWASSQAFRKARSPYGLIGAQLAHMRAPARLRFAAGGWNEGLPGACFGEFQRVGLRPSLPPQVVCLRRKSWKCGVIVSG